LKTSIDPIKSISDADADQIQGFFFWKPVPASEEFPRGEKFSRVWRKSNEPSARISTI